MRKILTGLVFLLAGIVVFPVVFLMAGSLMGNVELGELLGPVLSSGNGYASWKLLPAYPTLRSYVEVLLDTPEFFIMFWNSVKITFGVLAGHFLIGTPAAWGFAKFYISGKKVSLYLIYCPYDDAFSGNDAEQLSGIGQTAFTGYPCRDHFASRVFHVSGFYYVPFF